MRPDVGKGHLSGQPDPMALGERGRAPGLANMRL
jgi:hypothetical protein